MKNFLRILIIISSPCLWVGCENLIKEDLKTNLNHIHTFETVEGCNAALNGVYATFFRSYYYAASFPELVQNTSGMYTNVNFIFENTFGFNSSFKHIEYVWSAMWQTVQTANDVIYYVPGSPVATKARTVLGEAYFIRAKQYFDMVRMWGAVPLRTEPSNQDNLNMARTPVEEVYRQILEDLDSAKTHLPEPANQVKGRPHVYAAYALAQRVYLTLAGNGPNSPYWTMSLNEGLKIYQDKPYQLVKSFNSLWEINNQNTSESIFEIQGSTLTGNASISRIFLPSGNGNGTSLTPNAMTWGRAAVNKEVYDMHRNQYENDPRIEATYLDSFYYDRLRPEIRINCYPLLKKGNKSYTYIRKYVDLNLGTSSNINLIYLRYADVLLMLAEAENELRGPDGAYVYVNEVLDRARDKNGNGLFEADELQPARWSSMTRDEFRNRIMQERNYEMIGEMNEFFDVRRRGKEYFKGVLEYHNTYAPNRFNNEYVVPTDEETMSRIMLLPIPNTEFSTNTLITLQDQNPGW